jgi:hypothetical protein
MWVNAGLTVTMVPAMSTTITPSAMCAMTVLDKRSFSSFCLRSEMSAKTQTLPASGRPGSIELPLTRHHSRLPSRRRNWRSWLASSPRASCGKNSRSAFACSPLFTNSTAAGKPFMPPSG